MIPQEYMLNIIYSVLTSMAFFYVYKKSRLTVMLLAGALTYFELLVRLFMQNTIMIQGLNILILPEILIIIYMIWFTYNDGFKWVPFMLTMLIIIFILLYSIGHTFYGDIGAMFALVMIIWINVSRHTCKIDPWECHRCK